MTVKKDHDFPNHLLAGPAGRDTFEALAPDPLDFPQAIGFVLDNGEDVRPEGLHELFGEERPDSIPFTIPEPRYFSIPVAVVG